MNNAILKLAELQQNVKCPKSQFNSFGKYHYRNCEDILEGLKPHLGDSIIVLEDFILTEGDRVYVKATATLFCSDGSSISASAMAREPLVKKGMDESQITGAASSYARKYALSGLLLLDDNKDSDSSTTSLLNENTRDKFLDLIANKDGFSLSAFMSTTAEEEQILLFNSFEKGKVSEGKKIARELMGEGSAKWQEFVVEIIGYMDSGDAESIKIELEGFEEYEKRMLANLLGEANTRKLGAMLKGE